jgi:hypothetical protein
MDRVVEYYLKVYISEFILVEKYDVFNLQNNSYQINKNNIRLILKKYQLKLNQLIKHYRYLYMFKNTHNLSDDEILGSKDFHYYIDIKIKEVVNRFTQAKNKDIEDFIYDTIDWHSLPVKVINKIVVETCSIALRNFFSIIDSNSLLYDDYAFMFVLSRLTNWRICMSCNQYLYSNQTIIFKPCCHHFCEECYLLLIKDYGNEECFNCSSFIQKKIKTNEVSISYMLDVPSITKEIYSILARKEEEGKC